jgi:hypothetical protein
MSSSKRNHHRENLAYLAARIMAEDGTLDFETAKRKAARQAGAPGTQQLPDNREIEAALRSWQALYRRDTQEALLRHLRTVAVKAMTLLEPFNPWLTGSVLSGTAGPHSDVNLQLFSDQGKELELYLLNRQVAYQAGTKKIRMGDRLLEVPVYSFSVSDTPVNATLFPADVQRIAQKTADGRVVEKARLAQVKELLTLPATTI